MKKTRGKILVVGAGVCGMTIAYKLVESGYDVTIIEKQAEIGGLAKTFKYNGFYFDSGPHRFFSTNKEVMQFLNEIFHDDLITAPMRSSVYFLGKYYDWPLSIRVILRLPLKILFMVFKDFFHNFFRRKKVNPQNFREYIIQKYGKTLYELDFGPYTEKFTKLPNDLIHPDWAKAGMNRAVIKEDIKMNSLSDLIKTALKPKRKVFIYYPQNGISEFHNRLKEFIIQRGGKVLLNHKVVSFTVEHQRIVEAKLAPDNSSLRFETVVWTAPINEISNILCVKKNDLTYLNIIIYNFCLKGQSRSDYQWIYYVDKDIIFNRLYNTVLFSRQCAPDGYYGLCVEVTCYEEDEIWGNPALIKSEVINALIKVGMIESKDEIINVYYEKLDKAYPIYKTNYRRELKENLDDLYEIANLIMAGRTGLFWYNNMDHSIENAFKVVESILHGRRETEIIKFWE